MPLDPSYLTYAKRSYGMDHDRYDWSMLADRPPVSWPDGAGVALWVNVALEFFPSLRSPYTAAAYEPTLVEDGEDVVAVFALGGGGVDLDAVVEVEQAQRPVAEPHHRIEGRKQCAARNRMGSRCRGVQIGGFGPAVDGDPLEPAFGLELVEQRSGDRHADAVVVAEIFGGTHAE